ncbi:MAG: Rid family detoxifying hydrolase [Alphaproteobacteria bacterium]|nr:Rid family detoxifying hydrolase [Alphaproteobacteria bacterium]
MRKEIVHVPGISDALAKVKVPLSPAVKANGFVFVSGMPPLDPETGEMVRGDIVEQTRMSLEAVRHVLEAAGSTLDKVVKVTLYIANAAYFPTVNDVYRDYFPKDPPARTFVAVGSWPLEFDIEVECVALAD